MITFGNTFLNFNGTYLTDFYKAPDISGLLKTSVVVKADKLNDLNNLTFFVTSGNGWGSFFDWPDRGYRGGDIITLSTAWCSAEGYPINECFAYTAACNADSTPVKSDLNYVATDTDTPIGSYEVKYWQEEVGRTTAGQPINVTLEGMFPKVTKYTPTLLSICYDRDTSAGQVKPIRYQIDASMLSYDGGTYAVEKADFQWYTSNYGGYGTMGSGDYAAFNDSGCYRISNLSAGWTSAMVGLWVSGLNNWGELSYHRQNFPAQIDNSYFSVLYAYYSNTAGSGYSVSRDQCLACYLASGVSGYKPAAGWCVSPIYAHRLINCKDVLLVSPASAELNLTDHEPGAFNTRGWWKSGNTYVYNDNSAYNPVSSIRKEVINSEIQIEDGSDLSGALISGSIINQSQLAGGWPVNSADFRGADIRNTSIPWLSVNPVTYYPNFARATATNLSSVNGTVLNGFFDGNGKFNYY